MAVPYYEAQLTSLSAVPEILCPLSLVAPGRVLGHVLPIWTLYRGLILLHEEIF